MAINVPTGVFLAFSGTCHSLHTLVYDCYTSVCAASLTPLLAIYYRPRLPLLSSRRTASVTKLPCRRAEKPPPNNVRQSESEENVFISLEGMRVFARKEPKTICLPTTSSVRRWLTQNVLVNM